MFSQKGHAAEGNRARSDGDAQYIHRIDLYDVSNQKITAESTRPYSPRNTCGRCHDYETIGHGWHFNAFDPKAHSGRDGEPWVWTDARTATSLPLTYRDWSHSFHPDDIGISPWSMTQHFGGRLPGGSVGESDAAADDASNPGRWAVSGALEIDCLACHAIAGAYDMNARRNQIDKQNFSCAPTAALHLGTISGNVSRIKEGADPQDESVKKKLPTVVYDARKFSIDGKVLMDLVRQPSSDACYQCHSQRTVGDHGIEERWIHDEDVHLRAGMDCVDCHRNGIDHHLSRGFVGQSHPDASAMVTLSCEGCHLGNAASEKTTDRPGRLGAPQPLHAGLPPIHFEKLACTACHSGPAPREEAIRIMTSLAHGLGEKGHRTGDELPAMVASVFTRRDDGRVYPHKAMWPAYWGILQEDGQSIKPLDPEKVYASTRKILRVRRNFVDEILRPSLKSSEKKKLLGPDRAKVDSDQWTSEERDKISQRQKEQGQEAFQKKVAASLVALEKTLPGETAVYVSAGRVHAIDSNETDRLRIVDSVDSKYTGMITWPLAHNVRPAGWSLGTQGCTECHSDQGLIFASTVSAVGPVDGDAAEVTMASLQGIDPIERMAWNQMFVGRKVFKYFVGASLMILMSIVVIGLGMLGNRVMHRRDDRSSGRPDGRSADQSPSGETPVTTALATETLDEGPQS